MTIAFSIKRIRSSSALRPSTSPAEHDINAHDQEPAASFLSPAKPKSSIFSKLASTTPGSSGHYAEHRRSSLTSILQSCFRSTDHDACSRRRSSSAFENDALFERYRYQTHQRKRSQQRPNLADSGASDPRRIDSCSNNGGDNNHDDDDGPPPRVICYQERQQQHRSILVNRSGHRHTASLQMPAGSSCVGSNSSGIHQPPVPGGATQHRRSKTATHIRHYSHISYISSSNVTAHSGDLTAKEFADIAGIRILSDDEAGGSSDISDRPSCCQPDDNNDDQDTTHDSLHAMHADNDNAALPTGPHHRASNSSLYLDDRRGSRFSSSDEYLPATATSSSLPPPPLPSCHKPHIWDDAFWRQPHAGGVDSFFPCMKRHDPAPVHPAAETPANANDNALDQPVLHEIRSRSSVVFKKGRFEVHVESL